MCNCSGGCTTVGCSSMDCIDWDNEFFEPDHGEWVTRDGKLIRITNMTDNHLLNAERMLARNVEAGWEVAAVFPGAEWEVSRIEDKQEELLAEIHKRHLHPRRDLPPPLALVIDTGPGYMRQALHEAGYEP